MRCERMLRTCSLWKGGAFGAEVSQQFENGRLGHAGHARRERMLMPSTNVETTATRLDIREMLAAGGPGASGGPSGGGLRPDSFLKLSIADAAKKQLEMVRQKQSTQELMDAFQKGGLPPSKYNTVYSILSRRASQVGDIINMKGDWALSEWYPNYRKGGKGKDAENGAEAKKESEKATA
jgi:hypothetical protein